MQGESVTPGTNRFRAFSLHLFPFFAFLFLFPALVITQPSARGGRGNPTASLYVERCAPCHGTDVTPGRAPTLFDDQWTRGSDDESILRNITNGIPTTEMIPFKELLTEQQIWQLVTYIRMRAGSLSGERGAPWR